MYSAAAAAYSGTAASHRADGRGGGGCRTGARAGPAEPSRATADHRSRGTAPTTRTAPPGKNQLFLLRLFTQNRYCPPSRRQRTHPCYSAPTKISSVVIMAGGAGEPERRAPGRAPAGPQRAGRRSRINAMACNSARRQKTNKNAASRPRRRRRRRCRGRIAGRARVYTYITTLQQQIKIIKIIVILINYTGNIFIFIFILYTIFGD